MDENGLVPDNRVTLEASHVPGIQAHSPSRTGIGVPMVGNVCAMAQTLATATDASLQRSGLGEDHAPRQKA